MIISEKALREIVLLAIDMRDQSELESIIEGFADMYDRITGTSAKSVASILSGEAEGGETEFISGQIEYVPSGRVKPVDGRVNELIRDAWEWLSPFLPDGAVMTSGMRDQSDQDRIIRNYAAEEGLPNPNDLDGSLAALKAKGYRIARYIGTGHGSGEAFDVSGADLSQIASAVIAVSNDSEIPVKFSGFEKGTKNPSIIENKNNAVHVGIVSAKPVVKEKLLAMVAKYQAGASV